MVEKQKGDAMKKFATGCLTVAAVIAAAVTVFILLIGRKGETQMGLLRFSWRLIKFCLAVLFLLWAARILTG